MLYMTTVTDDNYASCTDGFGPYVRCPVKHQVDV